MNLLGYWPERTTITLCRECGRTQAEGYEHGATIYARNWKAVGYVREDRHQGAVDRACVQIINAIEARHGEAISEDEAWRVVTDAVERLRGGQ